MEGLDEGEVKLEGEDDGSPLGWVFDGVGMGWGAI